MFGLNGIVRNYKRGYNLLMEEEVSQRWQRGLSVDYHPGLCARIRLSFLAIGASMALSASEMAGYDEPCVPLAVCVTFGFIVATGILILGGFL